MEKNNRFQVETLTKALISSISAHIASGGYLPISIRCDALLLKKALLTADIFSDSHQTFII
jgi:hypothetical protein